MDEHQDKENESSSKDRYFVLLLVLTGVFMSVLDGSVVSIALPTITQYFHVSIAQSQMIMTGYLVTITSLLLIFGKMAERMGKARLFSLGIAIFTASSLACGISTSLEMLVLCRIFQATGGAMMFSISAAIIFLAFPKSEQGRAMGYIGSTVAIGSILGPTLGGFIVDLLGWSYIFLINVPIGIAQMLLSAKYLKIEEKRLIGLEADWIGALTLITLIVSLMAFLGQLSYGLAPTPAMLLLALIFVLSLIGFIINESREKAPLLDLSIFRYPMFVLPSISLMLYFVANLMVSVLGPFYFEGVRGYTASQVGLIYLIIPAITVFGAPLAGIVYDRHQFRYLAALGMSIMSLAMIMLGYLASSMTTDIRLLLTCFVFMGLGGAFFQSPNNTELMRALPISKINIASSFTATIRNLGMALGVSLSGLLVSMQMAQSGYYGSISEASPLILASSISDVMMIAGGLCFMGATAAVYRGMRSE
ncbi:MFS transporter [Methanothrix sp.]|uniref:MFS transporter n=1 Tax=Methanothrix sp. TaxID=90426 RepID=UPI0025EDE1DA|nr:MFS transporter [Methanothrix sp.]